MSTLTIPQQSICINSEQPSYSLYIRGNNKDNSIIQDDHCDVNSIIISFIPSSLKSIEILIGCDHIIYIDVHDITLGQNILNEDFNCKMLPLSKCQYMKCSIKFNFDKKFLSEKEGFEIINETLEVIEYSDTESEFYDGIDYYYGKRVHRRMIETDNKIRNIIKDVVIELPEICILTIPGSEDSSAYSLMPIWQKKHSSDYDEPYLRHLAKKHNLKVVNYKNFEEALSSNKPFFFYIMNYMQFEKGICGLINIY